MECKSRPLYIHSVNNCDILTDFGILLSVCDVVSCSVKASHLSSFSSLSSVGGSNAGASELEATVREGELPRADWNRVGCEFLLHTALVILHDIANQMVSEVNQKYGFRDPDSRNY